MNDERDTASRSTSVGLIEQVKRNHPQAWQRLVRIYSPLVYYWCRRQARLSVEDTAEVTQEVFFRVVRGIGRFDHAGPNRSFRGWLRVITANQVRDHCRRQSGNPVGPGGSYFENHVESMIDNSSSSADHAPSNQALRVYALINTIRPDFDPRSWQAFWSVYVDGRSRQEVAHELETTVGAINQAVYRIRRRIRKELATWECGE